MSKSIPETDTEQGLGQMREQLDSPRNGPGSSGRKV